MRVCVRESVDIIHTKEVSLSIIVPSVHYYFNVLFFTLCKSRNTKYDCKVRDVTPDRFGQPCTRMRKREGIGMRAARKGRVIDRFYVSKLSNRFKHYPYYV